MPPNNDPESQRRLHSQSHGNLQTPSYTGYSLIQNPANRIQEPAASGLHHPNTVNNHIPRYHHEQQQPPQQRRQYSNNSSIPSPLSGNHSSASFRQTNWQAPGASQYSTNKHASVASHHDLQSTLIARTSKIFHVIIVGGAFAGIRAAQDLEGLIPPHMITITVVERRDQYFYNLGTLRSMVKPELIDLVWLPYDNIFRYPHNRVIKGEVTAVYPNSVILKSGRKMDFDALLVSTGSNYPPPCKYDTTTSSIQGKAEMHIYAEIVRVADSILIIGGGPTGVGLAAEIATEFPNKTIIIVHGGERLLPSESNSESMSRKAYKKLKALGVKVFLNERVVIPEDQPLKYRLESRWLKTNKGRMLFSNFQFLCNGITFNTSLMDTLDPVFKHNIIDAKSGQIQVLPTMQINNPELPWIFSAGDVCNTAGEKQAYRADSQGSHVAKCMAKMAQAWGHGDPRWYNVPLKHWNDPAQFMAVAMGPNSGVTETPWIVLGDLPTRIMKSRELFLQRRYREFNLEFPGIPKRAKTTSRNRGDEQRIASQTVLTREQISAPIVSQIKGPRVSRQNIEQQRIRARGAVTTDMGATSYDLSKAMARAAISAAESLDEQFDSDRVSLSQPSSRRTPTNKESIPYANFYSRHQRSTSSSEISERCPSDEEDVNNIISSHSRNASQSTDSKPRSAQGSTTASEGSGSVCQQSEITRILPGYQNAESVCSSSSASVITSGTSESSNSSKAPSYTMSLMNGPILPRHHTKERSIFGGRSFFKSHNTIHEDSHSSANESTDENAAHPLPHINSVFSSSISKRSASNLSINLEQLN
ncbi:hypothetical protein LPJ66_002351 [Kickxella alabastrina]|uniref:Uncharacterized protein n=1 Tax=Kickxella alabastrina TaxID=61397 RepID=A0ACC1IQP8_9FUNG|nr:hypothetical protein LPJ66_002351 [Kickxella alabastrina]